LNSFRLHKLKIRKLQKPVSRKLQAAKKAKRKTGSKLCQGQTETFEATQNSR
jgi:hypothetical protein